MTVTKLLFVPAWVTRQQAQGELVRVIHHQPLAELGGLRCANPPYVI
jgi:hypothetical protein